MVKYYETTGGYFYKIVKNNKKRNSKKEYMKKNLKGGIGSNNNNINMNTNCYGNDFNDNNWIILVHGIMSPDEFRLPNNLEVYNYASLGDTYSGAPVSNSNDSNYNNNDYVYDQNKICSTAENTGNFIGALMQNVDHISKAEARETMFDMVLGGNRNDIPEELYGLFKCKDGEPERVDHDIFDPYEVSTLQELVQIISEFVDEDSYGCHTLHVLACRGLDSTETQMDYSQPHYGTINSSAKPFSGSIPSWMLQQQLGP